MSNLNGIFYQLGNLSLKRTTKQAIGFYFAYLILIALIGGFVGGFASYFMGASTFEEGLKIGVSVGSFIAPIIVLILGILVLKQKKLMSSYSGIFLVIFGAILAIFGGGLLGQLPIAYLTTKEPRK